MRRLTCLALSSTVGREAGVPEGQMWGDLLPQLRGGFPPLLSLGPTSHLGRGVSTCPPPPPGAAPSEPTSPYSLCPSARAQEELMNNSELVQSYRQQIGNVVNQANLQLFWNMYNRWGRGSGQDPAAQPPPRGAGRRATPAPWGRMSRVSFREESLLAQVTP